jgi:hypothetical protein
LAVVLGAVFGQEWLGLLVYLSVAAALALPPRIALASVVGATLAALAIVGGLDPVVLQTLLFGLLLIAVRRLMEPGSHRHAVATIHAIAPRWWIVSPLRSAALAVLL